MYKLTFSLIPYREKCGMSMGGGEVLVQQKRTTIK
jgi:hypothetical protein